MKKTIVTLMLACAGQMFAGGFWLQLGNPEASPAAGKMGAVGAGPGGIDRLHAKADMKAFTPSDVEAMLR